MKKQVGMAIIGCGRIGEVHAETLKKIPNVRLDYAVDIDLEKVRDFAIRHNIAKYSINYHEAIECPAIDGVIVCTPPKQHREIVVEAAKAKKHVLCEKPISLSLAEADEMIKACQDNDVRLMIGFVRRFDARWRKFSELIKEGIVGRPVVWRFAGGSSGPPVSYVDEGGGVFPGWGIHDIDSALQIFGPVKTVQSSCRSFKYAPVSKDTGTAIITHESGDQLILSLCWGLPQGARAGWLNDVLGREGVLLLEESLAGLDITKELDIIKEIDQTQTGIFIVDRGIKGKEVITYSKNDPFYEQACHFIETILTSRNPIVTGENGRISLEVALRVIGVESGI